MLVDAALTNWAYGVGWLHALFKHERSRGHSRAQSQVGHPVRMVPSNCPGSQQAGALRRAQSAIVSLTDAHVSPVVQLA